MQGDPTSTVARPPPVHVQHEKTASVSFGISLRWRRSAQIFRSRSTCEYRQSLTRGNRLVGSCYRRDSPRLQSRDTARQLDHIGDAVLVENADGNRGPIATRAVDGNSAVSRNLSD